MPDGRLDWRRQRGYGRPENAATCVGAVAETARIPRAGRSQPRSAVGVGGKLEHPQRGRTCIAQEVRRNLHVGIRPVRPSTRRARHGPQNSISVESSARYCCPRLSRLSSRHVVPVDQVKHAFLSARQRQRGARYQQQARGPESYPGPPDQHSCRREPAHHVQTGAAAVSFRKLSPRFTVPEVSTVPLPSRDKDCR